MCSNDGEILIFVFTFSCRKGGIRKVEIGAQELRRVQIFKMNAHVLRC